MCTAITFKTNDHYFGRNLDLEYSYDESVTITPRNFRFSYRSVPEVKTHYAIIGMAYIQDGYPLYYDAVNEKGVAMAALSFHDNACYKEIAENKDNIAPFEFIPWILGQCENLYDAKRILSRINIADIHFSSKLPNTPLHWMIAYRNTSITVECLKEGIKVYDNPVGVLTNNPTFDIQMFNLNNYMHLSAKKAVNHFSDKIELTPYSNGMGALGLPGDLSSASRFVRAAFIKLNSVCPMTENESVSQVFHILNSVEQQRGCADLGEDKYEITVYSACCNADKGIYYYRTYENSRITAVDMNKVDLGGKQLISYPLRNEQDIMMENQ